MRRERKNTFREQIAGTLIAGLMIQIAEFFVAEAYPVFSGTREEFSIGLWLGVAVAFMLAVHMQRAIDRALAMSEQEAERYMGRVYAVRTVGILLAAAAVAYFKLGYVMAFFLGILCLKFGVLLRIVICRWTEKHEK